MVWLITVLAVDVAAAVRERHCAAAVIVSIGVVFAACVKASVAHFE